MVGRDRKVLFGIPITGYRKRDENAETGRSTLDIFTRNRQDHTDFRTSAQAIGYGK
jgi:hypothetical protein